MGSGVQETHWNETKVLSTHYNWNRFHLEKKTTSRQGSYASVWAVGTLFHTSPLFSVIPVAPHRDVSTSEQDPWSARCTAVPSSLPDDFVHSGFILVLVALRVQNVEYHVTQPSSTCNRVNNPCGSSSTSQISTAENAYVCKTEGASSCLSYLSC